MLQWHHLVTEFLVMGIGNTLIGSGATIPILHQLSRLVTLEREGEKVIIERKV